MLAFEKNCQLLNKQQYKGFRRWQVEIWLLFEDNTSSTYAFVVQGSLLVLIIFSTGLILAQSSANTCAYYRSPVAGVPWESLTPCLSLSGQSEAMTSVDCERVCSKRLEPLEPGGPFHFFLMDAVCIGCFTIEFILRMVASPATVGLAAFCTSIANLIDLVAILPFYIDLILYAALHGANDGGGANFLRVLRIIRLSRVIRVLKFSKSLSGVMVLFRTVAKSLPALALIAAFSIFMCILWASIMGVTGDVGKFQPDYALDPSGKQGQYIREDGSVSYFSDMFEGWWWCLQTLTSLGYGVPWVSVTDFGKGVSIMAALAGTVVLALPIAVVGVTFDDEWVKQTKVNAFRAASCVDEYNVYTRNGTSDVRMSDISARLRGSRLSRATRWLRMAFDWCREGNPDARRGSSSSSSGARLTSSRGQVVPHEDVVTPLGAADTADDSPPFKRDDSLVGTHRATSFAPRRSEETGQSGCARSDSGGVKRSLFAAGIKAVAKSNKEASSANASPEGSSSQRLDKRPSVVMAEALSSRGTLFSAGSHRANQAYNLQADLHTLIDSHFNSVKMRARVILNEHREKLCRSLNTDLKAALRAKDKQKTQTALKAEAWRARARGERSGESRTNSCLRLQSLHSSQGVAGVVARASLKARQQANGAPTEQREA